MLFHVKILFANYCETDTIKLEQLFLNALLSWVPAVRFAKVRCFIYNKQTYVLISEKQHFWMFYGMIR
ncbi:hypothetical protein DIC78_00140 [Bacillus halotolerans]|nr:hypothetical protein DIC78_00140 [Bacillus halotolerans]PLR93939.1 hypothetical protein CTZ29_01605 [Bacillus halotolerans]PRR96450.1 hypothetical protein C6W26_20335 [Bacillus halotolerans]PRS23445.1 hypothetical protein C6W25_07270 [Bacillus halotolerans]